MSPDRTSAWASLAEPWDVVIIGGGITGAGILQEAVRQGLRAALLEQGDFASGTSSRSGKLVHGGLRYLKQGQVRVTWHSVRERERLLRQMPGLVNSLALVLPCYRGDPVGRHLLDVGMILYDAMAMRRNHRHLDPAGLRTLAPHIRPDRLQGGFWYLDALTDDARLVLRIIDGAVAAGAVALNYAPVEDLCRTRSGAVEGVAVRDLVTGRTAEVRARVVINAAGVWADSFRARLGRRPRLRLLRGSHLLFPGWRLPVAVGINLFHPGDGRPLYVLPWEGLTLVGTTDVDHREGLDAEPRIHPSEGEYLLTAVRHLFPSLDITAEDVLATFSGVRPVVGTGKKDPSQESRDYAIWDEELLTVTGGKLTTFGVMARAVMARARRRLGRRDTGPTAPAAAQGPLPAELEQLDDARRLRLVGRYGAQAAALVRSARPGELEAIPGTNTLWAEVRWAAERENVVHLDDLLLRRVRLGFQLPQGAAALLEQLRGIVQPALGWDDARWQAEVERYRQRWSLAYSPALLAGIPDSAQKSQARATPAGGP